METEKDIETLLSQKLRREGFSVSTDVVIYKGVMADIIAEKEGQRHVIEIKRDRKGIIQGIVSAKQLQAQVERIEHDHPIDRARLYRESAHEEEQAYDSIRVLLALGRGIREDDSSLTDGRPGLMVRATEFEPRFLVCATSVKNSLCKYQIYHFH